MSKHNISQVDFIKLDIQGAEYLALKGSKITLINVEVLVIESNIMNYNLGSTVSLLKLYQFLDSHGFAMYDIINLNRDFRTCVLNQVDIIWVKKSSNLWHEECTKFKAPEYFRSAKKKKHS